MHVLASCNLLAAAAAFAVATWPHAALARDLPAPQQASPEVSGSSEEVTPVYFGNGCFWGERQLLWTSQQCCGWHIQDWHACIARF